MVVPFSPRCTWSVDFPNIFIHTSVKIRDYHSCYIAAKSGDAEAALALVRDLLSDNTLQMLHQAINPHSALLVPVAAIEKTGFNAIPDAMAHEIGRRLGFPVESGELVQINKVIHTRANGWHRIVTPPMFGGKVEKDRTYVLIDDHVGLGGTLANMRGYIESLGGRVVAITTLTESRDARKIALHIDTLNVLKSKHGNRLEQFWQQHFGYGFDCFTEVEGGYVGRQPSFDVIRDSLVAAAKEARSRGISSITISG